MHEIYFGGLDFGSSGARITIINKKKDTIYTSSRSEGYELKKPNSWLFICEDLLSNIPLEIKKKLDRLSISGTSGTLLACQLNGISLGDAIPYYEICDEYPQKLKKIASQDEFLNNPFSGLAKALKLLNLYGKDILLRHQSDWITGWVMNNWLFGEEGNNVKLGWNIISQSWPKNFSLNTWHNCLPKIKTSGSILGFIDKKLAQRLNFNSNLSIVAGTTDSNAGFIASGVKQDEGLTVLGTTLVLKKFISEPVIYPGVSMHRVNKEWICGGASNAGCGVLSKFFSNSEIEDLSKQINPSKETKLKYLPLNCKGERFPINDPLLEPILEPRPVSDALFLQALFEGLATIELNGWNKIRELTGTFPKKIICIGGGSKNPQWRSIRQKKLNIPIISSNKTTSYGSALIALSAN
tara:strand:- start:56 stop:1285 length:1230 start_codon:yes stop_codon:yes gene_type:complete